MMAQVAREERSFDLLLASAQIIQGVIEIVFIEDRQSQHLLHRVILRRHSDYRVWLASANVGSTAD